MRYPSFVKALTGAMVAITTVQAIDSFFVSTHKPLMKTRFDPISFRGKVSGHVHTLLGPSKLNPSLSYEEARSSRCTTAEITDDMSAYWTPACYHYDTDQKFISLETTGTAVYWFGITGENETLAEMPAGLRFTAGAAARNHSDELLKQYIYFDCIGGNGSYFETTPQGCDGIRTIVEFPSCWDCKTVATEDGKTTHVTYPVDNKCPANFTCRIPMLRLETSYNFRDNVIPPGGGNFVLATGDSTGYGLHGDFFNGFSVPDGNNTDSLLNRALNNCPDMRGEARNCDVFQFQNMYSCIPEAGIVNEPIGDDYPIDKLPGNNPVWCAEDGKATDPNYVENATLISVTPPIPSGWSMIGCISHPELLPFQDDDILTENGPDNMTPEYCLSKCAGYAYAGIEYGKECTCSHSAPFLGSTNAMVTASECKSSCTGHPRYSETYCGGENFHMSIYSADNHTTNGTHCLQESDDGVQDEVGPTACPDSTVPAESMGSSIPITESPVATSTVPPLDVPSPSVDTHPSSDFTLPTDTNGTSSFSNAGATAILVPSATHTQAEATTRRADAITAMTPGVTTLAPAAVITSSFLAWDPDIILSSSGPLPIPSV